MKIPTSNFGSLLWFQLLFQKNSGQFAKCTKQFFLENNEDKSTVKKLLEGISILAASNFSKVTCKQGYIPLTPTIKLKIMIKKTFDLFFNNIIFFYAIWETYANGLMRGF